MDQLEIINAIRDLPAAARLAVAEATLQSLRDELPAPPTSSTLEEKRSRLAEAARIALPYYLSDPELTVFTALDGEDFYEYEEERNLAGQSQSDSWRGDAEDASHGNCQR